MVMDMYKTLFNKKILALMFTAFLIFSSCEKKEKNVSKETKGNIEKKVQILYPNWEEGIAITHLAKVALEDNGYDVDIRPIEPGLIYASLAKGDCDIFLDAWLPHTHKYYWKEYGDQINKLGNIFNNASTGLVVPKYVSEDSIKDLKNPNVAEKYNNKIIGIGSGAGIHQNTSEAIKEYNLSLKQITSSGPAMVASLKRAYQDKKPIVITGWKPHYMWFRFDLRYLDDPKNVYPKDVIAKLTRKGFKSDYPELTTFFENFEFSEKRLYSLMNEVRDYEQPIKGAASWYTENKERVNSWWEKD